MLLIYERYYLGYSILSSGFGLIFIEVILDLPVGDVAHVAVPFTHLGFCVYLRKIIPHDSCYKGIALCTLKGILKVFGHAAHVGNGKPCRDVGSASVLNTLKTCRDEKGKSKIRIGRRVGEPKLYGRLEETLADPYICGVYVVRGA